MSSEELFKEGVDSLVQFTAASVHVSSLFHYLFEKLIIERCSSTLSNRFVRCLL